MPSVRRNRSGNWEVRVSAGTDPRSGRRRTAQETYPASTPQRELRMRADALERRVRGEAGEADGAETVASFLTDYLAHLKGIGASPATIETYRSYANAHVIDAIGGIPLWRVRPRDIQSMLAQAREDGLSGGTLRGIHAFLQGAFAQAVAWGAIEASPMAEVVRAKAERGEAPFLDEEALASVMEAISGEHTLVAVAARLALGTGMRRGEVCGATWRCVLPDRAGFHVSTVIVEAGGRLVRKEPKSRAGIRTMSLDEATWDWLERWRERQAAMLAEAGGRQTADTPIVSLDGTVTRPDRITAGFSALCSRLGLDCTFHSLRHTHAAHLLRQGVDVKSLQRRLGHSSAAVTLNTYAHVLPGADERSAEAMAEVLGRARRAGKGGGDEEQDA